MEHAAKKLSGRQHGATDVLPSGRLNSLASVVMAAEVQQSDPVLGMGTHLKANVATIKKIMDDLVVDDMRALGLTTGEADVLSIVKITGDTPPAPTDLSNWLSVTTAGTAQRLNSLEDKKLIQRRRDPADGRRLTVHLTAKGRDLAGKVLAAKDATVADAILAGITPDQAATLIELTDRLVIALRQQVETESLTDPS